MLIIVSPYYCCLILDLFSLFHHFHFKNFSNLNLLLFMDRLYNLHCISLSSYPSLYPFAKHLRFYRIHSILVFFDFCCWQSIKYGFDGRSLVFKAYRLKLPAVHELDSFAEFAFFEPTTIKHAEVIV